MSSDHIVKGGQGRAGQGRTDRETFDLAVVIFWGAVVTISTIAMWCGIITLVWLAVR